MAIYSSNSAAQKTKFPTTRYKRTVKRTQLTSPLFLSDPEGRISKIFEGTRGPLGNGYSKETVVINETTGETRIKWIPQRDTFPAVKILQKALYLFFTAYARKRVGAGETFPVNQPLKFYKFNSTNNISKAVFTGVYDDETEYYVAYFQGIFRLPTDGLTDEGEPVELNDDEPYPVPIEKQFRGKADCNVFAQLDIELAKIHCYSFSGDGKDKTFVGHNYSRFKEKPIKTVAYQSIPEHPDDPSPGPKNDNVYIYKKPEKFKKNRKFSLTKFITRVNVIQDLELCYSSGGEPYNEKHLGWFYVSAIIDGQTVFGYCDRSEIWRTNMPESGAVLRKVLPDETVISIIRNNYYNYNSTENSWKNDHDLVLHMSPGSFSNNEAYYQFKFYVNMLLYANNETGIMPVDPAPGHEETIGLVFEDAQPMNNNFKGKIAYSNAFENTDPEKSNYQYFLEKLTVGPDGNPHYNWDWNGEGPGSSNTINLIADYYMWIPSREFADTLYAYINRKNSYLHQLSVNVRDKMNELWPVNYGISLDASLGITFGIPLHVEGGGSVYLYRKNIDQSPPTVLPGQTPPRIPDLIIGIRKSGYLKIGAEVNLGIGFTLGSVKSRTEGQKIGAQLYAGGGAGGKLYCETEYEFPLYVKEADEMDLHNDNATIALMVKFLGLTDVTGIVESVALKFIEGFSEYNIDPGNYLTRMEVRVIEYLEASAGAYGGLKLNSSSDDSDPLDRTPQKTPFWLSQIMKRAYAQLSLSASFEGCFGFEYSADYNEDCFDLYSGARRLNGYTFTLYTQAQFMQEIDVTAGGINFVNFSPAPYLGVKVVLDYGTTKPDYLPVNTSGLYPHTPHFSVFLGDGQWDNYGKTATEFGLFLKPFTLAGSTILDVLDAVDRFYIKKRISLLAFQKAGAVNQNNTHVQIKNFFSKSSYSAFGVEANAFVDIELSISRSSILESDLYDKFNQVIDEIMSKYGAGIDITLESGFMEILSKLLEYINPFSSIAVQKATNNFFAELVNISVIENASIHTEIGGGFAGAIKFTNITIGGNVLVLAVYHRSLFEDSNCMLGIGDRDELIAFLNNPLVIQVIMFFLL